MSSRVLNLKADQLDRLFELIRQENLHCKRSRRQEEPLNLSRAGVMARSASDSLRPLSKMTSERVYLL